MKKRSFLVVGAVLVTAAALVLGGCGGGSPEKIQAQLEKLQAEALALTAAELMKKIKQNKIDVNTHIKNFIEEIDLLKTNTIEMFLFGRDVEKLFRNHVMHHADFAALKKKIKSCQQIDHYSPTNPHFMVKASAQLGIDVPKNLLWG